MFEFSCTTKKFQALWTFEIDGDLIPMPAHQKRNWDLVAKKCQEMSTSPEY